jgi:DNA-directed RNA polymerase subunit RPC12/RpoP
MAHVESMALGNPSLTFGELAREQLEIEVTCPNCSHRRLIDGNAPGLRDRRVAGARFRCEQCGSVGLPELGKQRLWARRLAEHARKLR